MTICGIKLTHDGAVALIDNGKLVFSYEMEKLDNNPRYSTFCITMERVDDILSTYGYRLHEIDQIVIDGWDAWSAAEINSPTRGNHLVINLPLNERDVIEISELMDYGHLVGEKEDILRTGRFKNEQHNLSYKSYKHVTGHIFGAYCTSPFATTMEDAYILVWDGGMPPQLFYYCCAQNKIINLGPLFHFTGYMYINFAHAFEPFNSMEKEMSIAGKAMAYMAVGKVDAAVLAKYYEIWEELNEISLQVNIDIDFIGIITAEFIKSAKEYAAAQKIPHKDMLTTFQFFIQELILENLKSKVTAHPELVNNLCFAGGSALNIKWNNSIRSSELFKAVWVPPFPNDSGSAIGAACCEMVIGYQIKSLQWNVYSGPVIAPLQSCDEQYTVCDCPLEELAGILHNYNEPVVFLNGPAELGPRALGNRSILAAAVNSDMKNTLNKIKGREGYRPVAPICLEEDAPAIFTPGSADPYMLYEHKIKPEWKNVVPAICHLDDTARLQTVNKQQNPVIYELLQHYKKLSGIPLLCNTSANFNGKGFFPNIESVMQWDKVNFIWSAGKLYFKNKTPYFQHTAAVAADNSAIVGN